MPRIGDYLDSAGKFFGLQFKCPGCGSYHMLPIEGRSVTDGPKWGFNGDYEMPTLTPSINATTGPFPPDTDPDHIIGANKNLNAARCLVCHSFVTAGRIQFLGDCTHELKNQTVDLPSWPPAGRTTA